MFHSQLASKETINGTVTFTHHCHNCHAFASPSDYVLLDVRIHKNNVVERIHIYKKCVDCVFFNVNRAGLSPLQFYNHLRSLL